MPRNSVGVYTLPAGNPVVTNTTIAIAWGNGTMSDLGSEMTNSLDRSGRGGMLAALKGIDGVVGAPALSFTNEPTTGFYRSGTNVMNVSVGGTSIGAFGTAGLTMPVIGPQNAGITDLTLTGGLTLSGTQAIVTVNRSTFTNQNSLTYSTTGHSSWQIYQQGSATGLGIYNSAYGADLMDFSETGVISINGSALLPQVNNVVPIGAASFRFSTIYGVAGNFSGGMTVTGGMSMSGGLTSDTVAATAGMTMGNANQSGATVLDWYLEGTFTPALGVAVASPAYTTQTGVYQRSGNKIKFEINLVYTAGTNGGAMSITGLPTAGAGGIQPVTINLNINNASFTWTGTVIAYIGGVTTTILLAASASGATIASLLNPNAGTKDLYLAGEYFV